MLRPSRATTLRLVESCYAVLTLFALTQGPVYRVWAASAAYLESSPQPTMSHIYFATFVAVQLPAVFLLARNVKPSLLADRAVMLLMALVLWFGLTVLWSTLARHSLPEYVALVMTTCFGLYLSTRFSVDHIWKIVANAMAMGLGFSLFAIWRKWDAAVNGVDGHWIGIYYNRNSLAPVAAVAAIASIGMLVTHRRTRRTSNLLALLAVVLVGTSLVVLWKSESQTSPFALAVAAFALVFWSALRWLTRVRSLHARWWSAAPATLLLVGFGLFVALRTVANLSNISVETATFNSRWALWSQSWAAIQLKPWHGWGWQAAWHTPEFFFQLTHWTVSNTTWSHNGYHDLLLGGGVLAGVLFVAYLVLAVRTMDTSSMSTSAVMFVMIVFVVAAATQESFFIGSHFLWALLIMSSMVCVVKSVDSVEQQHPTKSLP